MALHSSKYFSFLILLFCHFLNSCTITADTEKRLERLQSTINAVETKVQVGLDIIGTGQAIATDMNIPGVEQTAQAAASKISDSGLVQTVQFVATSKGPDLLETVSQFGSDKIPLIQATAEAVVSENSDYSDIPIPNGRKEEIDSNGKAMAFSTDAGIGNLIEFYEKEMPENGWKRLDTISRVSSNHALIHFRKGERLAIISIYIDKDSSKTFVQISVQDK